MYWVGHSKHRVEYLVLVHTAVVVLLTGLAMAETGSTEPGRWQRFLRYRVSVIKDDSQVVRHLCNTLFIKH